MWYLLRSIEYNGEPAERECVRVRVSRGDDDALTPQEIESVTKRWAKNFATFLSLTFSNR